MSVVSTVSQYLGTPYVWGGSTPSGFDCSGLMQYSFAQNGISIPRTSQEQYNFTANSRITNIDDLQSGDLVFFKGSNGSTTSPGHVGIYVGNGQYIHAPRTGDVVKISNLSDRSDFIGGGRVVGASSGNLTTVSTESDTLNIVGKIVSGLVCILLGVLAVVFFAKAFNTTVKIPEIDLKGKAEERKKKKAEKEEKEMDERVKETVDDIVNAPPSEELSELMKSLDDDIESIKDLLKGE